jgi:hypothetical protein
MLQLHDTQVRAFLLNHICAQLGEGDAGEMRAAGLALEQLVLLRELSASNLKRLAAMRQLKMSVTLDSEGLTAGLRSLGMTGEAKALELYFLRNGASWLLMRSLFKVSRKVTYLRRRQWGARLHAGNLPLPPACIRRKIFTTWRKMPDRSLRMRYYHLHQAFPQYPIAALEKVILLLEPC